LDPKTAVIHFWSPGMTSAAGRSVTCPPPGHCSYGRCPGRRRYSRHCAAAAAAGAAAAAAGATV